MLFLLLPDPQTPLSDDIFVSLLNYNFYCNCFHCILYILLKFEFNFCKQFQNAREEAGEKWRNRALAAKMTRCLFARKNFAKEVDLSLILYNDRLIVRCPLIHVCGPIWWEKRCPYGELDDGFFSAKLMKFICAKARRWLISLSWSPTVEVSF